ncbi:MAG: hypothetical protein AAF958_14385 [Planctomycetota bacterium]
MFRVFLVAVATLATFSTGCRIVSDVGEADFPAYGGVWQRSDRDSGLVGSLFDPAGGRVAVTVNRDQPSEADEQMRQEGLGDDGPTSEDEDRAEQARRKAEGLDKPDDVEDADPRTPKLEDMEDEDSLRLRDLKLEDIEVKRVAPPSELDAGIS